MAKVYRVLKLKREVGKSDVFTVVSATEWGSEIGKARADLGEILNTIEENHVVSIESVEAPMTREEFVEWLNRHEIVYKTNNLNKNEIVETDIGVSDIF